MESNIKCLDCGKITRKVELGDIFYNIDQPSETMLVKESIVCPKCRNDISNGRCALQTNYVLMRLVAANISLSIGDVPNHLRGAYPINKKEYEKIKIICKSKPKLVSKF